MGDLEFLVSSLVLKYPVLNSLQNPIFLREMSVFIHLMPFIGLILSWSCKGFQILGYGHPKDGIFWYCKPSLLTSLALSSYNSVFFCLNCFYDYKNGWSDEYLGTLLDLALRVLSWSLVSFHLHTQCHRYSNGWVIKLALSLRIWWGFYLAFSCYCFVIHMVNHKVPVHLLVYDFIYVISAIFLCFVIVFGKVTIDQDNNLQENFLDHNVRDRVDSSKAESSETISLNFNEGLLSKLTFNWVGSLISKGYKNTLNIGDLPSLLGQDNVSESYLIFKNFLDSATCDKKVTSIQLMKSLIWMSWGDILLSIILCFTFTLAAYVGPYFIDTFVQYLDGVREFKNEGYVLISVFFIAKLVEFMCHRHWIFRIRLVGIRSKAVLIESIYKKSLTLSYGSKQGYTSGEMINLMSVDAETVGTYSLYMHEPWTSILEIVFALLILYKCLGLASVAALFATVVIMLANYPFTTLLSEYQVNLMESKDKRMKATSEILKNMRILKLQAWEMKFLAKVLELRNSENSWLKKFLYTSAVTTFNFLVFESFVAVITFGTCMLIGVPLSSGKILSALATFGFLQGAIHNLPDTVNMMIQTKVSLDRIVAFLCLDDLDIDVVERIPAGASHVAIEIKEGNFSWDPLAPSFTLKEINLRVQHGMRVAICGTVGSGKSALLSCILGEVPKISGVLTLSGSKAYVPQSPWIQSGKIVDNILFGQEMDLERYDRVLEACSLKRDLELWSSGDQTVIGERGVNLSGGQKQRIQIARALYQDADLYLFDDPFSAVDAHTSSHLFKECMLDFLESKTVIYVTHQMEFLMAADLILVMKNGRIMQAGKYSEILASGTEFFELVGAHEEALSTINVIKDRVIKPVFNGKEALEEEGIVAEIKEADDTKVAMGELVQEEQREKGRVGLPVYWKYITTAYGGALVPLILLAQFLYQALQILGNYWMAWATPVSHDAEATMDGKFLILVYVALSFGSAICILVMETLLMTAAYKTATSLFTKMHSCIFRAPMLFFDSTPSGRIFNRASTDQGAVDVCIPNEMNSFVVSLIHLLGIIVVMSLGAWQVFVIFIPIIAISLWYQQYYISSARELSRLIGVSKASVIQHFAETISGATTIRSFDQESRFCEISMKLVDAYSRPRFYNAAVTEWLSIRLDLLSSITFAASLIFFISLPVGLIDPGISGLSVIYGLKLNMIQGWLIWALCSLENKMISVERILQYSCLQSEPPIVMDENKLDPSWPSHGEIIFKDLQIRYAPHLPLVLRGISCTFQGGKNTGIVGRTGSGKSTLIQAIFRIVEASAGEIMIDGINIASIGLYDLRTKLSIIPQDPTMFEGTVRSNLDPLEQYSDDQIWEALDKCQLGNEVRKKEGKLDSIVTENGENWSMGQRQLVCLGRVLLKKSKVVILDEATASVDAATDNLINQTLREHFSASTVIIIAHRITSVISSDMVVLLSNGHVEECDSPLKLLENKASSFAKLVEEYTTRPKQREGREINLTPQ